VDRRYRCVFVIAWELDIAMDPFDSTSLCARKVEVAAAHNASTRFTFSDQIIKSTETIGMFSYACTKCGSKSQFDWANQCVLKIGDLYARSCYDLHGGVSIRIKGGSKPTIMAYHQQFAQYFTGWDDVSSNAVLVYENYCYDNGTQDPIKLLSQKRGMDRMAVLRGMMEGVDTEDEEGSDRHCAPKGITILDTVDVSTLESLPSKGFIGGQEEGNTTQECQALVNICSWILSRANYFENLLPNL
jgi:hypothetical protein